ncbi:hypothetical protein MMC10_003278 [Thelotrema lepadinum]|nr:hypothetical protein [Thelotrema lepadinum]
MFRIAHLLFLIPLSLAGSLPTLKTNSLVIAEIEQTLNRFSLAVDTHDWNMLSTVFTRDAVGIFGPGAPQIEGLSTLTQALRAQLEGTISLHFLSTQTVDHTGPRSVFAVSYLQGTFFGQGNLTGQTYTTYGRYLDTLILTESGWRVNNKTLVRTARIGNPAISS